LSSARQEKQKERKEKKKSPFLYKYSTLPPTIAYMPISKSLQLEPPSFNTSWNITPKKQKELIIRHAPS